MPELSILIPTLDEAGWIGHCICAVRASLDVADQSGEIVVCDGGSDDGTIEEARRAGADRTVVASAGRARQLEAGAESARGRVLVMLHADTIVRPEWATAITGAIEDGASGGWFQVEIVPEAHRSVERRGLAAVAWGINLRSRLFETATGDQSIFAEREIFEQIGGMPDRPILEGNLLARRLRRSGDVEVLAPEVRISGRRWEEGGLIRTTLLMYAIRTGHMAGVEPELLGRIWRHLS